MKKELIIIAALVFSINVFSQESIENILSQIEKNNTSLSALRKSRDAEKLGNKTGIYLANPEVEFHYLWSNPSSMGKRTDFSITQSFDFPTAYKYNNQISDIKNQQLDFEYKRQFNDLMLEARQLCLSLTFHNALKQQLAKRLNHANTIAISFKTKFDLGDVGILDYNKAQLNYLNLTKQNESNEIERNSLLAELSSLNGGIVIEFDDFEFETNSINLDFEEWYLEAEKNNPILNWLKQEIEKSYKQEKFNRALSLPKIHAGYMSEKVVGEQFQGLIVGLSIPLWENKNTVKQAKANAIAMESLVVDNKLKYYNNLKLLHAKVVNYQSSVGDYRKNLQLFDNSALLEKALNSGEISLINYLMELSVYYQSMDRLLDLELELNRTIAELNRNM
jgi:outer membrane protein TolC